MSIENVRKLVKFSKLGGNGFATAFQKVTLIQNFKSVFQVLDPGVHSQETVYIEAGDTRNPTTTFSHQ